MACTVPHIFGCDDWFNTRFLDLCEKHDALYVIRDWRVKWVADFEISYRMALRGYICLAFGALLANSTLGTMLWLWKKYVTPVIRSLRKKR